MKNKKLISAILAAASIAGGVVGAQAQDVGSLDSKVNNVIRDLNKQNDKIAALESKVNGIDTTRQVEAEATARKDADQKLQTNINAEATARKDADTKLQKQIDKNGIKADTALTVAGNGVMYNHANNLTDGVNENTKKIDAETDARVDADKKLNAKIDSNAVKVQEQLDAQDNKNKAQDESIKANGAAIKANKDAIKANADAIKANKAEADATNKYFNSRIENNTANIDNNKVAIENEVTARKDADTQLQANIEKETADRIAGDNVLNSRINQVESDANKGIAKASALAALHPLDYDPDNKFDIAAAGGFYKGENAFALGAFYRPNRNVMLSMGTTLTGGDNAYNVGLTFKIGKSGKHTEAGLTTADLYAMIGAMQDKMDQQQKKIEELEAKQAK